jgi:hypothetical protein
MSYDYNELRVTLSNYYNELPITLRNTLHLVTHYPPYPRLGGTQGSKGDHSQVKRPEVGL